MDIFILKIQAPDSIDKRETKVALKSRGTIPLNVANYSECARRGALSPQQHKQSQLEKPKLPSHKLYTTMYTPPFG